MSARQSVFISAVSRELRGPRQLVANTLQFLGYVPVWQDIFGTEQGDLRAMLRRQIDGCKGVIQLVGQCYGAEPATSDEPFGRVSYTQYEALYARQRGKKVWYLLLDESFPLEKQDPEPAELRELQAAYRRRLQSDSHLFHPLGSLEALEADILKLRDDLARLRRGARAWAVAVAVLLAGILGTSVWMAAQQRRTADEIARLSRALSAFQAAEVRQEMGGRRGGAAEDGAYAELARTYDLPEGVLREKLPAYARDLLRSAGSTTLERAHAAHVLHDYAEAERLALKAAEEARDATPPRLAEAISALELAGWVAYRRVEYAEALRHLRAAEELAGRLGEPPVSARIQFAIGHALYHQGRYAEAEKVARAELADRLRWAGTEDPDTLCSRNNLAAILERQGRHEEAEKEYRTVLEVRTRRFGPEHPETLLSRNNLAAALAGAEQWAGAAQEARAALAGRERVLGPQHPDTLTTRHILGVALQRAGSHDEAARILRAVRDDRERILGPEHPDTLASRNDMAVLLAEQGRSAEAEAEHREVLRRRETVLGPEHPDTLAGRASLACALADQGKFAEAEIEDRRVLAIRERRLGRDHPDVLDTRQHLALVLFNQQKHPELEQELAALLAAQERMYGSGAVEALSTRQRLAFALHVQGKYAEAVAQQEKALETARRADGETAGRRTVDASFALARYRLFARDFQGALEAADGGLALDPRHLPLLAKRGHALLFLGRVPEAMALYREHRGEATAGPAPRSWESIASRDLDDLEKAGLTHPESPRVRELLSPLPP